MTKIAHFLAATALVAAAPALAQVSIDGPWLRETAPGARVGAGYGLILNAGRTEDRLLGGSTPVAGRIEVHSMTMDGGVMRMRPVSGGLAVAAGGRVALKPGSYHLMLIDLKQPLRRGAMVPVTLRFARAGTLRVAFRVEGVEGAREASHAAH